MVEPWGLAGDRRWMLVDDEGGVITAREVNRLVLLDPEITADGLVRDGARPAGARGAARRTRAADPGRDLWESELTAAAAGAEADAWFSKAMGRTARLVYLDDPTRRPTSPDFSEPDDRVSFADGFPLLLATEESLAALNEEVVERSVGRRSAAAADDPLPSQRGRRRRRRRGPRTTGAGSGSATRSSARSRAAPAA